MTNAKLYCVIYLWVSIVLTYLFWPFVIIIFLLQSIRNTSSIHNPEKGLYLIVPFDDDQDDVSEENSCIDDTINFKILDETLENVTKTKELLERVLLRC